LLLDEDNLAGNSGAECFVFMLSALAI
jgi:hypothetical protein